MEDTCTYHIKLQGRVGEQELNLNSPLQVTLVREDMWGTLFRVSTDQPGLVGLMRYLHGMGFVLLWIRKDN